MASSLCEFRLRAFSWDVVGCVHAVGTRVTDKFSALQALGQQTQCRTKVLAQVRFTNLTAFGRV